VYKRRFLIRLEIGVTYANMNTLKTFTLMAALTALALGIGYLLGGRVGVVIAFGFALLMNFGSYWFSDKIVLGMYRARPVEPSQAPDLYRMVERLSANAGLPAPKLYVIDTPTPNAFATGRDPQHGVVAVTTGILQLLSRDELEGVIAHELAHIKNRDMLTSTIAATMAGAITSIAQMAAWASMFGGHRDDREEGGLGGVGALLMIIVAPIAAALIQMAISRSREYAADADGARICGKPLGLASALSRLERGVQAIPMNANPATAHMFIVSPLLGGGLASLFSTHPATQERVQRLQALSDQMGAPSQPYYAR
jgi:heat shock protein HtpX